MQVIAADAVRVAADQFGVQLDFSGESIAALEELLDSLRDSLKKDDDGGLVLSHPNQRQISVASSLFGAYLGEVHRRSGTRVYRSVIAAQPEQWATVHKSGAAAGDNRVPATAGYIRPR
jgi:hypothetical protein